MQKITALKLVCELAEQNALSDREVAGDDVLAKEQKRQELAIAKVRRHIKKLEG